MNELALFAGAGGGILGGELLGWTTVCAVEIDAFCARRLMQRQNEGFLAPFPIWDDVCTFDGRVWRGAVDVVSGGFPCQDISAAGKRAGIDGAKSGLWREMARIIGEVRPRYCLIENSQHLRTRGLVRVLKDLDGMRYHTARCVLGAKDVGAPHERKRMWIVAVADDSGQRNGALDDTKVASTCTATETIGYAPNIEKQTTDANGTTIWEQQRRIAGAQRENTPEHRLNDWWPVDIIQGVDDGVANRVDRVRATGNGQVPGVVKLAWEILTEIIQCA